MKRSSADALDCLCFLTGWLCDADLNHGAIMITLFGIFFGWVYADFGVYVWHRFILHGWGKNKLIGYRHQQHHFVDYPIDKLRTIHYLAAHEWSWFVLIGIAIPPLLIGALWYSAFFLPAGIAATLWGLASSMGHDRMHYENHFWWDTSWWQDLMKTHDQHHYDDQTNQGILFFGMDRIFGTYHKVLK